MTDRTDTQHNTYFEFDLPRSWEEIDLKPLSRDRSIKFTVDQRLQSVPELRPHRATFVRYLRGVTEQAWDVGSRYCAVFCQPAGDGLITGSLTVTVLPAVPGGNGADDVVEQLQRMGRDQATGTWSTLTNVELAGGNTGARQFGVREAEIDSSGQRIAHVFMYTFVPYEQAVYLVACASPAVDLADPLLELFGHVSDSFAVRTLTDGK